MKLKFNSGLLPRGFKASGYCAQIKKSGRKDLALFYSSRPTVSSCLFTSNRIQAAPLQVSRRHLKSGRAQAVIVNSGNANCMTGPQGLRDAREMTALAARELALKPEQVLAASTGLIGSALPMEKIRSAIKPLAAGLSEGGLAQAASAILTTDTFAKEVGISFKIGRAAVTISGIAKGAGMIAPKLKTATMLAFIFTDALVSKEALDVFLNEAAEMSFNAITIDGCMSTNDTVLVMANGMAENKLIGVHSREARVFGGALKQVCLALAKMIVRDAEGATKFIEVRVRGAKSYREARALAFGVANSNLFKCAMFGSDPNWGRIAAALGAVSSSLVPAKLQIALNKKKVFKAAKPTQTQVFLKDRNVVVDIDLENGRAEASVWTSDLSYEYVRVNAEYN